MGLPFAKPYESGVFAAQLPSRTHDIEHKVLKRAATSMEPVRSMGDELDDVPNELSQIGDFTVEHLLQRCHSLLHELEAFQNFLGQQKHDHAVEIRQFQSSVHSELKALQKVISS